jgi:hypothetical protein
MKTFLILSASLLLAISCQSQKKTTNQQFTAENPVIVLQKTVCFGSCPVYTLKINGDGKAELKAEQHLPNLGNFTKTLPPETVQELVNDFDKIQFFSLKDEYTGAITDLPTTYISFTYQGKSKKIRDYYGAPESLKNLEKKIAEFVSDEGWQAANPKTK